MVIRRFVYMNLKNENIQFSDIKYNFEKLTNEAEIFLKENNIKVNLKRLKMAPIHGTNMIGYPLKGDININNQESKDINLIEGYIVFTPFQFTMKVVVLIKNKQMELPFSGLSKKWQKYMLKKFGNEYKTALIENLCNNNNEDIKNKQQSIKYYEAEIKVLKESNNKIIEEVEKLAKEQELE